MIVATQRVRDHAAENVAFVGVVDPVSIDPDDGIIAAAANFDVAFKIAAQDWIKSGVIVMQTVGQHVDEIAGDAGVVALDDDGDCGNAGEDIELRRSVGGDLGHADGHATDQDGVGDDVVLVPPAVAEAGDAHGRAEDDAELPFSVHAGPRGQAHQPVGDVHESVRASSGRAEGPVAIVVVELQRRVLADVAEKVLATDQ